MSKFGHGAAGAFERGDILRLVVRDAVGPVAVEDADPLVGQRPHDRPVANLLSLLLHPVGPGPAGWSEDGLSLRALWSGSAAMG